MTAPSFRKSRGNIKPRPKTPRKRMRRFVLRILIAIGQGRDHAKLYDLVFKRALASQMASARLERTTIDLRDGTGRTGLRATGQVVIFPGFLTLYEEGVDDSEDENAK